MSVMTEYLKIRGVRFEEIPHRSTFVALEGAALVSARPDEVLKTLVIECHRSRAIVVIPASRRVNMHLVRGAVEDPHARLATEYELQHDFSYELGAMPPLGSLVGAKTYVDPEVFLHDTVLFSAGSQTQSVRCRTADLFRSEPISVVPLTALGMAERELVG